MQRSTVRNHQREYEQAKREYEPFRKQRNLAKKAMLLVWLSMCELQRKPCECCWESVLIKNPPRNKMEEFDRLQTEFHRLNSLFLRVQRLLRIYQLSSRIREIERSSVPLFPEFLKVRNKEINGLIAEYEKLTKEPNV